MIVQSDIARHVLISLMLLMRINFSVGGSYSLTIDESNKRKKYMARNYSHRPTVKRENFFQLSGSQMPNVVRTRELVRIASSIELYYRPTYYLVSRMAIALNALWASACSPYSDLVFLSMITVLESLLSTRYSGITHMLAEHAATLLGQNEQERTNLYEDIAKLYKLRNKLVHGAAFAKKGKITCETLHVDAKKSLVPTSLISRLNDLTIRVIRATLENRKLLAIIQSKKREKEITKELNTFYLRLLFK